MASQGALLKQRLRRLFADREEPCDTHLWREVREAGTDFMNGCRQLY